MWVLQRVHSGDGCDLVSTLCKYDLRKGDLFVLSWAMVRRVRREVSLLCCYVCCSDCVGVFGNACCVAAVVESIFILGVLKYVVCLCKGCDGCCIFCLYCEAWRCRCSCMGSVSVSSCRCCMFVSCVHPVAVLNVAFCMTCSLLMLVEGAKGHMDEAYSRAGLMTAL